MNRREISRIIKAMGDRRTKTGSGWEGWEINNAVALITNIGYSSWIDDGNRQSFHIHYSRNIFTIRIL